MLGLANGAWRTRVWCDARDSTRAAALLAPSLGAAALLAFAVAPSIGWLAATLRWPLGLVVVAAAATLFGMQLPW